MEAPKIVVVGASNLVSLQKLPLVACNCDTPTCCQPQNHISGIPSNINFKVFAKPGAKFIHNNWEKDANNLFKQALNCNPTTIVFYMDILMNSLTVPPWLNPALHKPLSPARVIHCLKLIERKANARDCRFVVVLCRRRKSDEKKLEPGTSSNNTTSPETSLDNEFNRLLKDNFFHYFDLKLSNSAFKVNDSAHQTQLSLNLSLGRIIRFFYKQDQLLQDS